MACVRRESSIRADATVPTDPGRCSDSAQRGTAQNGECSNTTRFPCVFSNQPKHNCFSSHRPCAFVNGKPRSWLEIWRARCRKALKIHRFYHLQNLGDVSHTCESEHRAGLSCISKLLKGTTPPSTTATARRYLRCPQASSSTWHALAPSHCRTRTHFSDFSGRGGSPHLESAWPWHVRGLDQGSAQMPCPLLWIAVPKLPSGELLHMVNVH